MAEISPLLTPLIRLSFAHKLVSGEEKRNVKTGETYKEYGCAFLFPKDPAATYARLEREEKLPAGAAAKLVAVYAPRMSAMEAAVMEKAAEYFGGKDKVPYGVRSKDLGKSSGWPFRDQGQKEGDNYEPGALFLSHVSTRRAPKIVDRARQPITDMDKVYSGVWAICSLNVYGYNNEGNKGISFGLNNVQIIADDERLGGGAGGDPEADFAGNDMFGNVDLADLGI